MKKKTKASKAIPDAYQFTEEDIAWHWANFDRCVTPNGPDPSVTQKELDFFNVVDEADRLSRIIKRLPTMLELKNYGAAAERERARLASWQPSYTFTQQDLAEHQEMIAREEFGPHADFMAAVAHLKESTGNFPTVLEVRTHCANQATS
jgi:hypothetical protein